MICPMTEKQLYIQKLHSFQKGFTLIEIMVVITILGLLAGVIGVAVVNQLEDSRVQTAQIQLKQIADAVDLYQVKYGKYPATAEGGLELLKTPPNNGKPVMDRIPKDPWDSEYVYICPGMHNQAKYDIESYGPDGVDGGGDDIESWSL